MLNKHFKDFVKLKDEFSNNEKLIELLDLSIIVASEREQTEFISGINFIKGMLTVRNIPSEEE